MPNGDAPDMKAMSAATYAATADHFDAAALSFWGRVGRETVSRIGLCEGDRVLDACCGTGATAEQLDATAAQRVRTASVGWLRDHDVHELQTNVVYAYAIKPDRHQPTA